MTRRSRRTLRRWTPCSAWPRTTSSACTAPSANQLGRPLQPGFSATARGRSLRGWDEGLESGGAAGAADPALGQAGQTPQSRELTPRSLELALVTLVPKGEVGHTLVMRSISVTSAMYRLRAATRLRSAVPWAGAVDSFLTTLPSGPTTAASGHARLGGGRGH